MATRAPMEKLPREGSWVQAPGREEMLQVVPTPGEAQPHHAGGCVGLSRVPARCAHVCRCCGVGWELQGSWDQCLAGYQHRGKPPGCCPGPCPVPTPCP